jgi:hypothetical protein
MFIDRTIRRTFNTEVWIPFRAAPARRGHFNASVQLMIHSCSMPPDDAKRNYVEVGKYDRTAIGPFLPGGGVIGPVRHPDEVALNLVLMAIAARVRDAAHALLFSNSSPFVPRQAKPAGFFREWRNTDSAAFRHARQTA